MTVDRGTIDRQLREIGEGEQWWEHREFRDLPYILRVDERLEGLARGKLLGPPPRLRPSRTWLLVVTDQRLVCLRQERFGRKQIEVQAELITRVDQSARIRGYRVNIATGAKRYRLRIRNEDAMRFARALDRLLPARTALQGRDSLLAPLSWIPGFSALAALPAVDRIFSAPTALPPAELSLRRDLQQVQGTVDRLETEVERLHEQVAFLESLLNDRARSLLPSPHSDG